MSRSATDWIRGARHLRGLARAALMLLTAPLLIAVPGPAVSSASESATNDAAGGHYRAKIRRTAHGIPHIKADGYGSLGFGYGYAFAEDNVCELAEQLLTASGRRSRFLGPDGSYVELGTPINNLVSDFYYGSMAQAGTVERLLRRGRNDSPPGPSRDARALVQGYAAGYNQYLRDTGVDRLPDPRCRGAAWVQPIRALDLWRSIHRLATLVGSGLLRSGIVAAQPPTATMARSATAPAVAARRARGLLAQNHPGSNAYGLGREATANGRGMVLANPHFPWDGPLRFYEAHLTIPGEIDVLGASLYGSPAVLIGHNARVAWSQTVSTAHRFTPFALQLVPGQPTRYVLDGRQVQMQEQQVTVEVLGAGGQIERRSRTLYRTRFGPVLTLPGIFEWTAETAYAVRDANADNLRLVDTYLTMGRAGSTRGLVRALHRHQGVPFTNTIAADSAGDALYADLSVVPHVTDEHARRCVTSPLGQQLFATIRLPVLDGWTTACNWATDRDAVGPGIFGPSRQPALLRRDFVTNSNDSHWLSNPAQPLTGFPRIIGSERTERSLRTRLGIRMVQQRLDGSDGLAGRKFRLGQLQTVMFNNRNYGGELVRDDLVTLCEANPTVRLADGADIDLRPACSALARWNLRDDLDSIGVQVFREFMLRKPPDWLAVPFDPADPVKTPHTLNRSNPAVLQALGEAVRQLRDAGVPLDAPLGSIQSEPRGDERIPIHGGSEEEGVFNLIIAPFQGPAGYPKVIHGSSFVMATSFTGTGPVSEAILTYSQSTNPTSPYHADQTRLYSRKEWVPMRYAEHDILSDPQLRAYTVQSHR